MANLQALDKIQHKDIKIITERGSRYGENIHLAPVIANELHSLVLDYPCCLMKDDNTGRFGVYALMGFAPGENLFLQKNHWRASYIPLHIRRQPFVSMPSGKDDKAAALLIDMDNQRVNTESGQALFDSDANPTDFLKHIQQQLGTLMAGMQATNTFIENLLEHNLIESIQFDAALADNNKQTYRGLYTINEENLIALSKDSLQLFHERGYLNACHYLTASLGHIRKLIDWKNTEAAQ